MLRRTGTRFIFDNNGDHGYGDDIYHNCNDDEEHMGAGWGVWGGGGGRYG